MGNRLTEKDEEYYGIAKPYINWTNGVQKVVKKLGQLEDAEEEIGTDLITIHKALKNGIWLENIYGEIINLKCYLICHPRGWVLRIADGHVFPKDHLKKWWLFEELSEEQKSRINEMFKDYKEELEKQL